jgi:hypothetical protein
MSKSDAAPSSSRPALIGNALDEYKHLGEDLALVFAVMDRGEPLSTFVSGVRLDLRVVAAVLPTLTCT